jgi:hypothetical protein
LVLFAPCGLFESKKSVRRIVPTASAGPGGLLQGASKKKEKENKEQKNNPGKGKKQQGG